MYSAAFSCCGNKASKRPDAIGINFITKRNIITGVNGFVAKHFLSFLQTQPGEFTVLGLGRTGNSLDLESQAPLQMQYIKVNLLNREHVGEILKNFQPDMAWTLS